MVADIAFVKLCKKEQVIPTFAKVNVSIRSGAYKLKRKIACLVMEAELEKKHREKCKLRKDIRSTNVLQSSSLLAIVYSTLLHQINTAFKSSIKVIKLRHWNKLHHLKLKQETTRYVDTRKKSCIKHAVHNFSSYVFLILHLISHLIKWKIHSSFIWSWLSYPNKIKRCYWGIRTV